MPPVIDKWDLMKMKSFYAEKETNSCVKSQAQKGAPLLPSDCCPE